MDLAPTTKNNTPTARSPEQESEIPPRIHQAKPLSFTNGFLKRTNHHHHHLSASPVVVTYKECLKNHAASIGGHALDGCGEFMSSPNATHTDPTSFKCAACGCHRNFHRREPDDPPAPPANTTTTIEYQPHHRHHPPPPSQAAQPYRSPNSASPPPISSSYPSAPHMLLALSGGLNGSVPGGSRKRFRTKFSQNQKDRMYEFAERVGWKMQKRDDELVQGFCNEIGVDKGVLKVWMHNNKNTFARRDGNGNGGGSSNSNNDKNHSGDSNLNNHHHHHQFENDNVGHVGTNGSSSSS